MDQLNAELFYPQRSTKTVQLMHAECIFKELRDPGKATSDYLSSVGGKFSWGQTKDDEHAACIGKMATTDPAESHLLPSHAICNLFDESLVFMPQP